MNRQVDDLVRRVAGKCIDPALESVSMGKTDSALRMTAGVDEVWDGCRGGGVLAVASSIMKLTGVS